MKKQLPAKSPEERENQLIALAIDLAEDLLRKGTATSQVIVHFLKLATIRASLEKEKLMAENELTKSKKEKIEHDINNNASYNDAIEAMKSYGGSSIC